MSYQKIIEMFPENIVLLWDSQSKSYYLHDLPILRVTNTIKGQVLTTVPKHLEYIEDDTLRKYLEKNATITAEDLHENIKNIKTYKEIK